MRYQFIRECVDRGEVVLKHISSKEQRAYIMTKALVKSKFESMSKFEPICTLVSSAFEKFSSPVALLVHQFFLFLYL